MTPLELRQQVRSGQFRLPTAGYCGDFAQANLVMLPQAYADDFLLFCQRNPKACPVLGMGEPGQWNVAALGRDIDLRTDLPGYYLYRDGQLVARAAIRCTSCGGTTWWRSRSAARSRSSSS